jgi:hypothetical protein
MSSFTAWNKVFEPFEVDVEGETLDSVVVVLGNQRL